MAETRRYQADFIPTIHIGREGICTYCGDPATCWDHCIPWAYLASTRRRGHGESSAGILAPACDDCNQRLSARIFATLYRRADWIRKRLWSRYGRYERAPLWSPEELAELGGALQSHVKAISRLRCYTRARLYWMRTKTFNEILVEARLPKPEGDLPPYLAVFTEFLGVTDD